jgi:hypothetical protein
LSKFSHLTAARLSAAIAGVEERRQQWATKDALLQMSGHAHTKDQPVEQLAIGLFAKLTLAFRSLIA